MTLCVESRALAQQGSPQISTSAVREPTLSYAALASQVVAPDLTPCPKGPAPRPYDGSYRRTNSSGFLDTRMVIDSQTSTIRNLEQVMGDLQALTEQVRCQTANTRLLFKFELQMASECAFEPPVQYAPYPSGRVGTGFPDVTAVIAGTGFLRRREIDILGDIQVRVQRLHCEQSKLAQMSARLLSRNVTTDQAAQAQAAQQPCRRPAPSPSYVNKYIRYYASGIMDYKMANNTFAYTQEQFEGWLDDLQTRIEQTRCQQRNAKAQINAIIAARVRSLVLAQQLTSTTAIAANDAVRFGANGGVKSRAKQRMAPRVGVESVVHPDTQIVDAGSPLARAVQGAALSQGEAQPAAVSTPPVVPPRPAERDCSQVAPDPSYQQPARHMQCQASAQDCDVYVEFTMNFIADLRANTQRYADDLQVRLAQSACEQQNLNTAMSYLIPLLGNPSARDAFKENLPTAIRVPQ